MEGGRPHPPHGCLAKLRTPQRPGQQDVRLSAPILSQQQQTPARAGYRSDEQRVLVSAALGLASGRCGLRRVIPDLWSRQGF